MMKTFSFNFLTIPSILFFYIIHCDTNIYSIFFHFIVFFPHHNDLHNTEIPSML